MIWVFGDSYAQQYPGLKDQWMQRVSNLLGDEVKTSALSGSAIEYTYYHFNLARPNIKENDIVIVALTTHSRRWFFKKYPGHTAIPDVSTSGFTSTHTSPTNNPKENEALEYYSRYLEHLEIHEIYIINFLNNLQYLTEKLNLHTIILVNFYDTDGWIKDKKGQWPLFHWTNTKLIDVSLNELTKDALLTMSKTGKISDIRVNHFSKMNHIVLADKIIDNIKNKTPIDLTTGFFKNIITDKALKDQEFMKEQSFNFIMKVS